MSSRIPLKQINDNASNAPSSKLRQPKFGLSKPAAKPPVQSKPPFRPPPGPAANRTVSSTTGRRPGTSVASTSTSGLRKSAVVAQPRAKSSAAAASSSSAPAATAKKSAAPSELTRLTPAELRERIVALKKQNAELQAKSTDVEVERSEFQGLLEAKEALCSSLERSKASLTAQLQAQRDALAADRAAAEATMLDMQSRIDELKAKVDALARQLKRTLEEKASLQVQVEEHAASISTISTELSASKSSLDQSRATCQQQAAFIDQLQAQVKQHTETIARLEHRSIEEEHQRRVLHNTIQELKGNIRVFCRVRPLLPSESAAEKNSSTSPPSVTVFGFPENCDKRALEVEAPSELSVDGLTSNSKQWEFSFDRVFRPDETNSDVFEEISQLVQSAVDGYKVCIFAYGQTGSGKTFTMEGQSRDHERGMIPRAVDQIFAECKKLQAKSWAYECEAAIIEIYNEQIRDLLWEGRGKGEEEKHEIRITKKGKSMETEVTNMTKIPVKGPDDVYPLLRRASHNRVVAETKCNEHSSRSHSVFRLTLTGENKATGQKTYGVLNLVDLAGSERLKVSGATGDRLKETQNINKSLTCLGDVISALASGSKHVPYRNSKLTYLLQESFGGDSSKTLMFVNLAPNTENLPESLCSLRFASKVNSCQIGTARKQVKA